MSEEIKVPVCTGDCKWVYGVLISTCATCGLIDDDCVTPDARYED